MFSFLLCSIAPHFHWSVNLYVKSVKEVFPCHFSNKLQYRQSEKNTSIKWKSLMRGFFYHYMCSSLYSLDFSAILRVEVVLEVNQSQVASTFFYWLPLYADDGMINISSLWVLHPLTVSSVRFWLGCFFPFTFFLAKDRMPLSNFFFPQ